MPLYRHCICGLGFRKLFGIVEEIVAAEIGENKAVYASAHTHTHAHFYTHTQTHSNGKGKKSFLSTATINGNLFSMLHFSSSSAPKEFGECSTLCNTRS